MLEAAALGYGEVSERMRSVASKALELAPRLELLFVTNVRSDDLADLGPDGVLTRRSTTRGAKPTTSSARSGSSA
jgi:hypothetical protein